MIATAHCMHTAYCCSRMQTAPELHNFYQQPSPNAVMQSVGGALLSRTAVPAGASAVTATVTSTLSAGADAAAFQDPLMRAAGVSDGTVSGKLYDTSNNWTTVRYAWTGADATRLGRLVGTWDAPKQQLQWWMGKRQVQTDVTKVSASGAAPETGTKFYRSRDDAYSGAAERSNCRDVYGRNWKSIGVYALDGYSPFYPNKQEDLAEPDGRSAQVYFVYNASGPCGGKVWLPEGVTINPVSNTWNWEVRPGLLGMVFKRPRLSMQESIDGFWQGVDQITGNYKSVNPVAGSVLGTGSHTCSKDQQGSSEADNQAARELLHSLLLPGGADITWEYATGKTATCSHQSSYIEDYYGSWKLARQLDDGFFGPNTVYLDGKYPAPFPDEPPLEETAAVAAAVYDDYYDENSGHQEDTPTLSFPQAFTGPGSMPKRKFYRYDSTSYSQQQVRFGMFDSAATYAETFSAGYFFGPAAPDALPPAWYGVSWCPHQGLPAAQQANWAPGQVKCTLSITPVQGDVASSMPSCAASLPQGIPFITCRHADGMLLEMPATLDGSFKTFDIANQGAAFGSVMSDVDPPRAANIVAAVELVIAPQTQSTDTDPPKILGSSGKLPDVACNKRAYSPRFGGRCAAPIVQYLAYDEAYHESANRAAYGLPEYGGCLAGGLMRSLGNTTATSQGTWDSFKSWWTPPLWPADAWYNLKTILGSDAAADAFLNDQESLNSLFVYQREFKVPTDQSPAGNYRTQCQTLSASQLLLRCAGQQQGSTHAHCDSVTTHNSTKCWKSTPEGLRVV